MNRSYMKQQWALDNYHNILITILHILNTCNFTLYSCSVVYITFIIVYSKHCLLKPCISIPIFTVNNNLLLIANQLCFRIRQTLKTTGTLSFLHTCQCFSMKTTVAVLNIQFKLAYSIIDFITTYAITIYYHICYYYILPHMLLLYITIYAITIYYHIYTITICYPMVKFIIDKYTHGQVSQLLGKTIPKKVKNTKISGVLYNLHSRKSETSPYFSI